MVDAETGISPIGTSRLLPVDALRGLIIVFMALDHANHFVAQKHSSGEMWGGPFPTYSHVQGVDQIVPVDVYVPG